MKKKILIVEDEKKLNNMLKDYLEALGYSVIQAFDGISALKQFNENPNLIILDIMIPGIDGFDVTRKIREKSDVPIIILTAKVEEQDKIFGLDIGADDYMLKPFSMKELAARIRVQLRKNSTIKINENENIKFKSIEMNTIKRTVLINKKNINLTSVQFEILKKFLLNPGRVFTRLEILEAFNDISFEGYERTIDVHIKNIRKEIEENPKKPKFIQTIWGVGYKLSEEKE